MNASVISAQIEALKKSIDALQSSNIWQIVLTFTGVILSAVIAASVSWYNANRGRSVQYITNHRVEWLQSVRKNMAQFFATAQHLAMLMDRLGKHHNHHANRVSVQKTLSIYRIDIDELNNRLNLYYYRLRLYLNPNKSDKDHELIVAMEDVMDMLRGNNYSKDSFTKTLDKLVTLSQECLKTEWDRCKDEVIDPRRAIKEYKNKRKCQK